jgi:glycerophosphoryl diester phosphodiesterase
MEKQVLGLVSEYNDLNRVVFSSFNHESIRRMSDLIGPEKCGLLTSDILFEPWSYLERIGAKSYHPMVNSLQQKHLIKECRKRGIKVNVWTADSEFLVSAGLLAGADAIITNYPDKAMILREQFEKDGGLQAVKAIRDSGFPLAEEGYYG